MRQSKHLWVYALVALAIVCCCGSSIAQVDSEAMDWAPIHRRAASLFFGAEGGWMKNMQAGSFQLICKCWVDGGSGNSGIGSLFIEFAKNPYISFGMKLGMDNKLTSTSSTVRDTAVITYVQMDSIALGPFSMVRLVDISATYFFFAPYFKISPFGEGIFIQVAPEIGFLTSSRLTHKRALPNSQITLDNGQIITNVRFENGIQKETLQDGAIPNVRSLRIALLFGVGYDIPIFANFSLLPQASYNYPLTTMSTNPKDSDWKISSFEVTLGLKYRI